MFAAANLLICACVCVCQPCSAGSTYEAQPFYLMASKHKADPQRNTENHENPKCRVQPQVIMTDLWACDPQRLVLLLITADGWAQNTNKTGGSASMSMCLTSAAAPPPQIWEDSCVTDEQNDIRDMKMQQGQQYIRCQRLFPGWFWVLFHSRQSVKSQSVAQIWTWA